MVGFEVKYRIVVHNKKNSITLITVPREGIISELRLPSSKILLLTSSGLLGIYRCHRIGILFCLPLLHSLPSRVRVIGRGCKKSCAGDK
jgi:hypothetical protein